MPDTTPQLDVSASPAPHPSALRFENPDPEWWCWHPDGWESAGEGTVRDARTCTRGKAAAFFSSEGPGLITEVRVWKRYAVPMSHLDAWEYEGDDAWRESIWPEQYAADHDGRSPDDDGVEDPPCPLHPPDSWRPTEYAPVWRFVHRSTPGAIPIWVCGVKGDKPPQDPSKPVTP